MIGYYIHHHGRGHQTRAGAIAARLGRDVTALTSIRSLDHASVYADVVHLPRDDADPNPVNPTAGGRLHWVPQHDAALSGRMLILAEWMHRLHPAAVVVDVSVEVATLAKLFGIPVIVMAMPGHRNDAAHDLVYGIADHILAAWPGDLYMPTWLIPHIAKTTFVGGISRFDGRPNAGTSADERPMALVLSGAGGSDLTLDAVNRWQHCNPDYRWQTSGVTGTPWISDPWPGLTGAAVVIAGAGQNAIADIATAQRPAVIVPQARPFNEQAATAEVLERDGLAVVESTWPQPWQWSGILERARNLDPERWRRWQTAGAAHRAADAINRIADRSRPARNFA